MPDLESVLAGLNEAQREAARALRGPVAILAGAGTGKTTTITHRIACQVWGGAFEPSQILAVTFTDKAAGELRARLAALGVEGVEARTFHSAALSQLSRLWSACTGESLPEVLDHKAPVISSLANSLPPPHKFLPRRELAGEIEWAKNRMIPPERYLDELADHEAPIPAELMLRVYDGYERRKRSMGRLDFEDMLGLVLRLFDEHPEAAERVWSRFAAFTVDEYQDVNPLQASLLERWLGDRDDLCVVGDDYQTIYAFTGASPSHLLGFTTRFPHATVVRLEENYRSTPEVLELANRLATRLGGFRKTLRATRSSGPPPLARAEPDEEAEVGAVVQAVRRLSQEEGVSLEEIAVLYRINARSEPFEEAFAAAAIPYQVRDGAFLRRPGPRAVLQRLKRSGAAGGSVAEAVEAITDQLGYDPEATPDPDEEVTRQSDLGRMRSLAAEFERAGGSDAAAFGAELAKRFSTEHSGRGVNLLTYHRAKGLEFDAVFLPRLLDGELPFRSGRARAEPEEERRLLYVGITRARRYLFLTWPSAGRARPSPFLDEMELAPSVPSRAKAVPGPAVTVGRGGALFDRLKEWRRKRANADGVPAYVVFHDRTLAEIAERRCKDWADLAAISGVGPAKLERYADEVISVVAAG
ncbi:MAG TPA: ATP-dependent DNA helicase UvrD2 [Actinomycetota bacterium]|nr:ATP-dependent DNA helicase UvrD2 [Actinomycetota bacterium]